ncbi:MAG: DinB family protein [Bryobacterales bacterium]|nr:DinB family protein [Bryobacteraceae bacterium]MDW8355535.1 DinB family protein [Bryobacterales bacterium]
MPSDLDALLERFRRGPELVAVAITGAAGAELDFSPGPGKWSIRQVLCHLADSELVAAVRFRMVIAEDHPTLAVYDQDLWAARLDYTRRKISQALDTFRRTRSENYELLCGLPPETFSRTAVHPERGRLTLLDLVRTCAEHDERHARQLQSLRQQFRHSSARA